MKKTVFLLFFLLIIILVFYLIFLKSNPKPPSPVSIAPDKPQPEAAIVTQNPLPQKPLPKIAMFRGNSRRTGVYSATDSKHDRIDWKFRTDKRIESSPVIYDDVVYVATYFGSFYAIDAKTGQEKWKVKLEHLRPISPAIAEGTIFFGSSNYLYALDIKSGQEKWKFNAYDSISSPLVEDDVIYFGSENKYFYAVNIKTGLEKWKYRTGLYVKTSPATYGDLILFGSNDGYLYALDKHTGSEAWKFKAESAAYSPAIADGVVYFGDMKQNLYAVDIKTGQDKWRIKTRNDVFHPTVAYGLVFLSEVGEPTWSATSGLKKKLYICGVDAETGKEKLRWETNSQTSIPSVAEGVVYVGTQDGEVYAIDTITEQKWKYKIEGRASSPPAIAHGSVFVGTSYGGPYLYAIPIDNIKRSPIENSDTTKEDIKETAGDLVTQSAGLTIEEYRVFPENEIEEIEGMEMPEVILKNRNKWRGIHPHYDDEKPHMDQVRGREEKLVFANTDVFRKTYKIVYKGKPVYEIKIVDYLFDEALKSLHAYKGHWFLEYMQAKIEGKQVLDYFGTVIVNGENLNKKLGYQEVFNYMFISDKPFYFFVDNENQTRMAYGGEILPLSYKKVVHYACCSLDAFNPRSYKDMVVFFALKDGYWYYVEAGVYK